MRRFLAALLAVNVVSTLAFACYAAVGIDSLSHYYIGYFYFSAPVITLLVIALAVVHAPPVPLGAVLAAGAAVLGVAAFAAAPATAVSTEDTDAALPHAVQAVAAQAGGKTIVIRFNHNAWIDVNGFLVQAERTGVRACVAEPDLDLHDDHAVHLYARADRRRRAVLVQRAGRAVRDDGHRHPQELADHRGLRTVVACGAAGP